LGGAEVQALRSTCVAVEFFGKNSNIPMTVVPDLSIDYDVILGLPFLRSERITIDMNRRKLSCICKDGSCNDFYLDDYGHVNTALYRNVTVSCAADVRVTREGVSVPINVNFNNDELPACNRKFLFETRPKKDIVGVDGIVSLENKDVTVIVRCLHSSSKIVRKGTTLGRVSTMVELDTSAEGDFQWSREMLKRKV
jgi:hypothetical protein